MSIWPFLFYLGTAVGSFLNVLAVRYKAGKRIFTKDILTGRSACPHCHKTLRWFELIPFFSFILQLGRCRRCGKLLSWQYPLVELAAGLIFVLTPIYLPAAPIWIFVLLTLLLITLIDLRLSVIPDQLNLFLGLLAVGLWAVKGFSWPMLGNQIIGALIGFCAIGLIIVLTKGKGMGIGDWKMAVALGLLFGWPNIIILLGLSFVLGGVVAVLILINSKKKLKDSIPFGPFLAAAALLVMIFGQTIIKLYL